MYAQARECPGDLGITWRRAGPGTWRPLLPFLIVVAFYFVAVGILAGASGLDYLFRPALYLDIMGTSAILGVPPWFLIYFGHMTLIARERHPLRRIGDNLRATLLSPPELLAVIALMMAIALLFSAFTAFKLMLPHLHPFALDPLLARIDRAIHFGIDPWRLTHALIPGARGSLIVNVLYNAWLFVVWIFLFVHIFWLTGARQRARYLLAFALCWILVGSLAALLLSSAGPAYYDRIVAGGDLFAPLMERLAAQDALLRDTGSGQLWALSTQEMLWRYYTGDTTGLGAGISAMPSMHVTIAVLMALSARQIARPLGWLFTLYALAILAGSVHLGWHYAIDGYAGAALAALIWWLAGRLLAQPRESDSRNSSNAAQNRSR